MTNFDFDTGNLNETRQMIKTLGGVRLPVFPETYVVEGYDDFGGKTRTFYRKSSATGFYATEFPE